MAASPAPRRCLRNLTPYAPGRAIAAVRRELGLKRVVKLASNENPLGSSPKALARLRRSLGEVWLYPEGGSPELREVLARHHGVDAAGVIVGNGSDELIRLFCEAYLDPDDEVVVSQYGFIRFKQQSQMMGARVIEVPMSDWTHDLATMARATSPRTKLVFVANPNNPTGTYNTASEVRAFLEAVPSTALIVLDEAYCHYARETEDYPDSLPELLRGRNNVSVLRTFSKAYGLAGLRVGYAVADPEVVGWLDRIRMPFNVNLPAQQACAEALKDEAFLRRSVRLAAREGQSLARDLRNLGLEAPESAANFLFVRSPVPGKELFKSLLRRGLIVRPLDEYGLPHHLRITIGDRAQNRLLVSALRAALAEPGAVQAGSRR